MEEVFSAHGGSDKQCSQSQSERERHCATSVASPAVTSRGHRLVAGRVAVGIVMWKSIVNRLFIIAVFAALLSAGDVNIPFVMRIVFFYGE